MVSLEEALSIRSRVYKDPAPYPGRLVVDRGGYLYFPHPPPDDIGEMIIGSHGIIVDKKDGHWHSLGSACSVEQWFWAHERGIKHHAYTMVVEDVSDVEAARVFLWQTSLPLWIRTSGRTSISASSRLLL